MSLKILNTPIYATIQDEGRFGYEDIGVSQGGAMDLIAYKQLNMLLNNNNNAPCVEIVFGQIEFLINKPTTFATTGAISELYINNQLKQNYQTYSVRKNDVIKIGKIIDGVRIYFSVKGGFKIKKDFGSVSTSLKLGLGGIDRGKLKKDDLLDFEYYDKKFDSKLKQDYLEKFDSIITLRVLLSYQHESFDMKEKEKFFSNIYTITNDFNAMGCKLDGISIKSDISNLISEGICYGAIQIPPDGKPIILLNERQTIGGYPKIGAVIPFDCYKLAQARPNMIVSFEEISLDEARDIQLKFINSFS